jgi:uracil-DNA glycosylase family 4
MGTTKQATSDGQVSLRKPKTKELKLIQAEKLSLASEENVSCIKCGLFDGGCRSPFIQPYIPDNYTHKFLLIGDNSTEYERTGSPFKSLGGKQLQQILQKAGIKCEEVAFMPVLRCRTVKAAKMAQIRACAPFVFRSVEQLHPKFVVAMGPNAGKSLCNKGTPGKLPRQRGRKLASASVTQPFTYFRTSSIAQLGTSPNEAARFKEDLERFNRPKLAFPKNAVPTTKKGYIGFDTEYTPQAVLCGAISDGDRAITVDVKNLGRLSPLLSQATIIGHNLPVDLDALLKAKVSGLTLAMEAWLRGNKQRDTL